MLKTVRTLNIPNLEIKPSPFQSVTEYGVQCERVPTEFPRPYEHFVFADYLIDCPVLAADFSTGTGYHGRIIGYSTGIFWIVADSPEELVVRLTNERDGALWGKG